jgi:Rrf2 family protein
VDIMLRVSTRARYGLRMMLDVAQNGGEDGPVSLGTVSERTGISRGYLEQVAHALRSARLLHSVSGRHGGYRLAAPTSEITVGRIFEALNGPTCLVDCIDDPVSCTRSESCECRLFYALVNENIVRLLHGHTLADLLNPEWARAHGGHLNLVGAGDERPAGGGCNPTRTDDPPRDLN